MCWLGVESGWRLTLLGGISTGITSGNSGVGYQTGLEKGEKGPEGENSRVQE